LWGKLWGKKKKDPKILIPIDKLVEAATLTLEAYLIDYLKLIVLDFQIYPHLYPRQVNP